MDETGLLKFVAERLEATGIRYYVTGSFATFFHGEPRTTNDIDIVVVLAPRKVKPLLGLFDPNDFYFSEDAALNAIKLESMFNLIHNDSGIKVDLIVSKDDEYSRLALERARPISPAPGFTAMFISPEDVILNKLTFYQEGHSDRHIRDIRGVVRISAKALDLKYLEQWAAKLGVSDEWNRVKPDAPR